MNRDDRKILSKAQRLIAEAMCLIEEVGQDLEFRVDNIMESFPDGNQTSERLEEEKFAIEELIEALEEAQVGFDDLGVA